MNVKNVIIINDYDYSQGGASKVAADTADLLVKKGLDCTFFSVVHSSESSLNPKVKNVTMNGKEFISYSNKIKGLISGLKNVDCALSLNKLLDSYSPDDTIVHVHGWTKACSSYIFKVLKKRKFKTVLTLHEYFSICPNGALFNFRTKSFCDKVCCSAQCFFTDCDSRNYIYKIYRFIREKQYYKDIDFNYIYPIFVSKFQENIIKQTLNINKSAVLENPCETISWDPTVEKKYDFIYIGRADQEKGIDLFIELAGEYIEKKFLIVGNYQGKVLENIVVTGWISETEVVEKLKQSRCLVFPSLWPETFGLNVVKALSCGIPCLVSSNTAATQYVHEGNGLIFEQGNITDLIKKAKQIETINPVNGFSDTFTGTEKYIGNLLNIYNSLL